MIDIEKIQAKVAATHKEIENDPEVQKANAYYKKVGEEEKKRAKEMQERTFIKGEIAELIVAVTDGYTPIGDYNVIFPPPTYVEIVEFDNEKIWRECTVRVLREEELPDYLKGTMFRTAMAEHAKKGKVKFIGSLSSFWEGDDAIGSKYFNRTYEYPKAYVEKIKNK